MQEAIVVIPAVISVLIFGLKKALGEELTQKYKKYIPGFAIGLGCVLSFIFARVYGLSNQETLTVTLQGIVVGAAAVGYREVVDKMKSE